MKMNKFFIKGIVATALIVFLAVPGVAMFNHLGYSSEEGGMGLPHDQAVFIQEKLDEGMSFAEATAAMIEAGLIEVTDDYVVFEGDKVISSGSGAGSDNSQQQGASEFPQTSTVKTETPAAAPKAPAKVYTHDFDSITDEARESFVHFSQDGVPESMYLNINSDSVDNILTGKELYATTSGKETGTVNFVDGEGKTLYTWIIETGKWTASSDDGYSLDLATKLEETDLEGMRTYTLSVQDVTLPEGTEVSLKAAVPYDNDTEIGLYTVDADGKYTKVQTASVDNEYITIVYTGAVTSYILSAEDLISLNEEEVIEEAAPEETVEEPAPEPVEEVAEPEMTEEPVQEVPAKKSLPVAAIIGIIAVILAGLVGIFAYIRKKR